MDLPLAIQLAWISLGIATFVSGYSFKYLDNAYQCLALFLWVTAAANVFGLYIKHTGTNLSVLPVLSLCTLLIFSRLYLGILMTHYSPWLLLLVAGAVVVILFDVYYSYKGLSVKHFYALGTVSAYGCIVVFCLCYFWNSLQASQPLDSEWWTLNSVFLLYFSICSLLFFSINFLINEALRVVLPFWILNALSGSLLYLFLSYKMWQQTRQPLAAKRR